MISYLLLGGGRPGLRWPVAAAGLALLGALCYLVLTAPPPPGSRGSTAVLVFLLLASAAWAGSVVTAPRPLAQPGAPLLTLAVAGVLGVAGALVADLSPSPYAIAFPCVAGFYAGLRLPLRWSLPVLSAVLAALGAGTAGHPGRGMVQAMLLTAGLFLAGLNQRQFYLRKEEATRTAALAERARIAREIHDVLGHSLAGLTIQLEAARALLAAQGDPGRALGHVEQGHRLAAAALTETREAVAALRDDLRPLPELLADLVGSHRDQAGGGASFTVRGTPRPLAPAATLALYRGAQEALTNARRHAPGACVRAELRYEAREAVLTVGDRPAGQPAAVPPSRPPGGPGYGLTGMRERAELAGGSLQAGPGDGGWRVELRVPA